MNKEYLNPGNFTKTIGAYSHGIKVNLDSSIIIFITGQIAMDKEGNVVAPNNIETQTEFIFKNIETILKEGDASLSDVVKTTIYLTDISHFKKVSEIRNKYFQNAKPASTLVEINNTVKEGCDVEIEVIAIK